MKGIYQSKFVETDGTWGVIDGGGNYIAWFNSQETADAYCNLKYVYDRFKHLDKILMDSGFDDGSIRRPIQRECWKAIKNAVGEE
jgi:hypothetical protein